ncbi:uncharacterized protein L201_001561 [Kwoniella dendrophila CBS 6074]|uniref:Auxin efflux carrier n=1 Tax=Kwoniella dendrophila CBS 6074 TaxID=1295534 RepID=A0AAX4JMS7_9TREE
MTTETGAIVYKAFAPTIKMMICIGFGMVLTKRMGFKPVNAKGVSILSLNISLPFLIFSSMVSSFTPDNIKAFGPLLLIAVIYQLIGLVFAFITRELFYVPKDFHYGILVMGILSNWGNVPTAVVQTMAKGAPFNPDTDVDLGVAYIAVFILVINVALFPLGLHKVCAWDFREEHLSQPDQLPIRQRWLKRMQKLRKIFRRSKLKADDEEKAEQVYQRKDGFRTTNLPTSTATGSSSTGTQSSTEYGGSTGRSEKNFDHDEAENEDKFGSDLTYRARNTNQAQGEAISRKKSRASSFHSMMETTRPIPPTAPFEASGIAEPCKDHSSSNNNELNNYHHPIEPEPLSNTPKKSLTSRIWKILEPFFSPFLLAIIAGVVCSVIQPIKALFVNVDGWSVTRIPNAPNDEPPLSFIMDTATFLGAVCVPGALVLLGASFGRLKFPKNWNDTPFGAIIAMTVFKMIIIPVIGVFLVEALRDNTSLYPREDKMRTFVAILLSGTPSSTNQLVITQLYNPEGTADTLAAFLALQYLMMPILSTALAAIALYVVK